MAYDILHEIVVAIPSIIIALVASGGFWAYVEHRYNDRRKKKGDKLDDIAADIKNLGENITKTGKAVDKLEQQVTELYNGQMQCATKLEKIEHIESKFGDIESLVREVKNGSDLSVAYARDRLNHLANTYMKLGYIPQDEIVAFKLLGQAYIDAGGNSETKTKYNHCIQGLEVKDIPRKVLVTNPQSLHIVQ